IRADLVTGVQTCALPIFPDRAAFAVKVRHTRNYYTHFLGELREKGKAVNDDELPRLTEQMRGLLLLCILRDLGISGKPAAKVARSEERRVGKWGRGVVGG